MGRNAMNRRMLLLTPLAVLPLRRAWAQATTRRIRGRVVSLDARTLTVATREGPQVTITLAENVAVAEVKPLALEAIQPNSFVGIASLHRDGQDTAVEVLVFPEAARGSGEGSYPWDLAPESTMTNATVATVAAAANGRKLALTYKGGTRDIVVPPGVPIVTFAPADTSLLVPGAPVFIGATVGADGSLSAARVTTGRDGNAPPM
jgi:hypothetical protein